MIETPGAIANLDQILEVETMDGIYVGPNDLGIVLGMASGTDREEPEFIRVLEDIARRANKHARFRYAYQFEQIRHACDRDGIRIRNRMLDAGLIGAGAAATVKDVRAGLRSRS